LPEDQSSARDCESEVNKRAKANAPFSDDSVSAKQKAETKNHENYSHDPILARSSGFLVICQICSTKEEKHTDEKIQ